MRPPYGESRNTRDGSLSAWAQVRIISSVMHFSHAQHLADVYRVIVKWLTHFTPHCLPVDVCNACFVCTSEG